MQYPCFLGLNSKNEFVPIGWSYYEILANSKNDNKADMNLDKLWVKIYDEDPRQSRHENRIQRTIQKLEVIFPDFKFFATIYPSNHFEKYYSYGPNLSSEEYEDLMNNSAIGKAYENLRIKLDTVEESELDIWNFPF